MICFQFQFFLSLIPTIQFSEVESYLLWFAFNFSSFYLWYQQKQLGIALRIGCDLLSISVLSIFDTNSLLPIATPILVVICFQFQFFLSLIPTRVWQGIKSNELWFAFNFSSFYLWYQQITSAAKIAARCDLLSISVLSIFDTNYLERTDYEIVVVICFQFQFFLSLIPTKKKTERPKKSCDLLSISVLSIFDTNPI